MAQYLNSSPFPAELMRLRSKFKSHWAALFEQIAHAQSCRKVFQVTLLQTYRVRAKSKELSKVKHYRAFSTMRIMQIRCFVTWKKSAVSNYSKPLYICTELMLVYVLLSGKSG